MIELLMAIERLQFSKSEVREFEFFYIEGPEPNVSPGQSLELIRRIELNGNQTDRACIT